MQRDFPEKFLAMAKVEHELTDLKGSPVTMLKDQSNEAKKRYKETGNMEDNLVFLIPHEKYLHLTKFSDIKGREPEPLTDCNGLSCGTFDLEKRNKTEKEINYKLDL